MAILVINLTNLPRPVPKTMYKDNSFFQFWPKNLTRLSILPWFSGLPNHLSMFKNIFPKIKFLINENS